jgi:hypothetical protein
MDEKYRELEEATLNEIHENFVNYGILRSKFPQGYTGIDLLARFYHGKVMTSILTDFGISHPKYDLSKQIIPNEINVTSKVSKESYERDDRFIQSLIGAITVIMNYFIEDGEMFKFTFRTSDDRTEWDDKDECMILVKSKYNKGFVRLTRPVHEPDGYVNIIFLKRIPHAIHYPETQTIRNIWVDGIDLRQQVKNHITKHWIWG